MDILDIEKSKIDVKQEYLILSKNNESIFASSDLSEVKKAAHKMKNVTIVEKQTIVVQRTLGEDLLSLL